MVEQPAELRARRSTWPAAGRTARGTGRPPAVAGRARCDQRVGAGVLPDDRAGAAARRWRGPRRTVVSRWLVMPSAATWSAAMPALGERLGRAAATLRQISIGVVLDPARRREVLLVLPLGHRDELAGLVEHDAPGRRGALVDRRRRSARSRRDRRHRAHQRWTPRGRGRPRGPRPGRRTTSSRRGSPSLSQSRSTEPDDADGADDEAAVAADRCGDAGLARRSSPRPRSPSRGSRTSASARAQLVRGRDDRAPR